MSLNLFIYSVREAGGAVADKIRDWSRGSPNVVAPLVTGTCNVAALRCAEVALSIFARPIGWIKGAASYVPGVNFVVNTLDFPRIWILGKCLGKGREVAEDLTGKEEPEYLAGKSDEEKKFIQSVIDCAQALCMLGFVFYSPAESVMLRYVFPYVQAFLPGIVGSCVNKFSAVPPKPVEPPAPPPPAPTKPSWLQRFRRNNLF